MEISIVKEHIKHRFHDYGHEKLLFLFNSSFAIHDSITESYCTGHNVFWNGHIFGVSVKHFGFHNLSNTINCAGSMDLVLIIDSSIYRGSYINITYNTELRIGDEASAMGFVRIDDEFHPRFWSTRLSGKYGEKGHSVTKDSLNITVDPSEYIFGGASQINGLSGSAVINGYGYTLGWHI